MNARSRFSIAVSAFACLSACSLRSLERLRTDDAKAETAGNGGESGAGASGGANATGGSPNGGASGASGGSGNGGVGGAGAGGSPSGGSSVGGSAGGLGGAAGSGATAGAGGAAAGGGGDGGAAGAGMAGSGGDAGGAGGSSPCASGAVGCPLVNETAYTLRPSQDVSNCADVQARGVDDGVPVNQYDCRMQINQTYWAEHRRADFFLLRSALSGKCLVVEGALLTSGARIVLDSCDGSSSQLWRPVATPDGWVKFFAAHSGLALDVGGQNSTANDQPLLQSPDDDAADKRWRLEAATTGAFLRLGVPEQAGSLLHAAAGEIVMGAVDAVEDAEWKVVPGLATSACASFVSRNEPGEYLRNVDGKLFSRADDGSDAFALDATFCFRRPLSGTASTLRSFESVRFPGSYLVRENGRVLLEALESSSTFRAAATFSIGP